MNGPEERAARTGLRVVVVDDDGELRDEVVTYLVLSGFQVAGARDGAGLDRLLAAGLCDIAVLDVGLPGESGIELARRLRDRPATGVVMLTGHDHIEDRLQGLRAGADAYLTNPSTCANWLPRSMRWPGAACRRPALPCRPNAGVSMRCTGR